MGFDEHKFLRWYFFGNTSTAAREKFAVVIYLRRTLNICLRPSSEIFFSRSCGSAVPGVSWDVFSSVVASRNCLSLLFSLKIFLDVKLQKRVSLYDPRLNDWETKKEIKKKKKKNRKLWVENSPFICKYATPKRSFISRWIAYFPRSLETLSARNHNARKRSHGGITSTVSSAPLIYLFRRAIM